VNVWILCWFVIAVLSTLVVIVCAVALVRHILLLGRTAKQAQDEIQPIVDDIARQGREASAKTASFQVPGSKNRS
jgi:hypothetical protein